MFYKKITPTGGEIPDKKTSTSGKINIQCVSEHQLYDCIV